MISSSLLNNTKSVFTFDLRALAVFRIFLSLILLVDLGIRFSDLEAHYTDQGILPMEALYKYLWNAHYFSLYTISNYAPVEALVFLVNFICAFCLLIGYRTRLFTFLCYIFILSLHNRNMIIHQGGDDLIRLLLFWTLFLPWGYYYSVDSLKYKPTETQYTSLACLAYISQIFFLYFFSALLKSSPEWRSEFTAIYYALSLDQITTPIGKMVHPYYELLRVLTAIVYYIEFLLPFVLFIPFFNRWFRLLFVFVIAGMQINIYLMMNVGLFSFTSIVCLIPLIPKMAMDKIISINSNLIAQIKGRVTTFASRFKAEPLPSPAPSLARKGWKETLVALFLLYCLAWNMGTVGTKVLPDSIQWVGYFLRIDQHWGMFSPAVFKDDGWFILRATTKGGREIDLIRDGKPVDYTKPAHIPDLIKNDRWRKYQENILFVQKSHFRIYYCGYMMNKWNKKHKDKDFVKQVDLIYMKEVSLPDYKVDGPKVEVLGNFFSNE